MRSAGGSLRVLGVQREENGCVASTVKYSSLPQIGYELARNFCAYSIEHPRLANERCHRDPRTFKYNIAPLACQQTSDCVPAIRSSEQQIQQDGHRWQAEQSCHHYAEGGEWCVRVEFSGQNGGHHCRGHGGL